MEALATVNGVRPNASARALLIEEATWDNRYRGTAEQLVNAALCQADMLPGQPGRGKTQCTYDLNGQPVNTGPSAGRRLVVRRFGKNRFQVEWPVEKGEAERRRKAFWLTREAEIARQAEADSAARTAKVRADNERAMMVVALGNAFARAYDSSPARFNVGDRPICWTERNVDGEIVEIVEPYGEYNVSDVGYRLGYVVERDGGRGRCFVPAYSLLGADYTVRHLQLVNVASGAARATT